VGHTSFKIVTSPWAAYFSFAGRGLRTPALMQLSS